MPFSDITVPEGDSLTADINPATRDIAVNMNSVASLSGISSPMRQFWIEYPPSLWTWASQISHPHTQGPTPGLTHNLWIQATQKLEADEEVNFLCTESTVLLPPHSTWKNWNVLVEPHSCKECLTQEEARTEPLIVVSLQPRVTGPYIRPPAIDSELLVCFPFTLLDPNTAC